MPWVHTVWTNGLRSTAHHYDDLAVGRGQGQREFADDAFEGSSSYSDCDRCGKAKWDALRLTCTTRNEVDAAIADGRITTDAFGGLAAARAITVGPRACQLNLHDILKCGLQAGAQFQVSRDLVDLRKPWETR